MAEKGAIWGAEEFKSYWDGTMPPAERRLLEGAALEDPFLADALEGYAHSNNSTADIAALSQRLAGIQTGSRNKTTRTPVVPGWMRIAAMLVLIAGSCWGIYRLSQDNRADIAATPSEQANTVTSDTTAVTRQEEVSPNGGRRTTGANIPANNSATADASPSVAPSRLNASSAPDQTAAVTSAAGKRILDDGQVAARSGNAPAATTGDAAKEQTLFQGKVVDARGTPVPYVSISTEGKKGTTTTDLNGNFSLTGGDSTVKATVRANGFPTQQAFLDAPAQNRVVLREAPASLEEVLVMSRKKSENVRISAGAKDSTDAVPLGGWMAFNSYLQQEQAARQRATAPSPSGMVQLSFEVDRRGKPVKIRVEQKLCSACDKEAMRVLAGGPKWMATKGKRVTVSIPF